MNGRVLIVDDDKAVLSVIYKAVSSNGIEADTAESGEEALEKLFRTEYSLLLLDINLGGIDGFTVVDRVRKAGLKLPILIISARTEDYDALYGLNIGADDYITKPFNPVMLGAKVKAVLRRTTEMPSELTAGPFVYNTSTLRLFKNGEEIFLTGKENALMKLFLDNVGRIFSRDMLYEMIWGETIVDDNTVMVYINRLRHKIEDDPSRPRFVQNVRGIGYRFTV